MNLNNIQQQFIVNSKMYLAANPNNNPVRIEDCFRSKMDFIVKQYKLFSLVPEYSFTRKYVHIDYSHLKSLLGKVRDELDVEIDLIDERTVDNSTTYLFSQTFDFEALRLNINYNGKVMFANMVRTDGYSIDFLLAEPTNQTTALGDLGLSDFTVDELADVFHLWGVDPGLTNIYTAADGHTNDGHRVLKYSTDEYYTRAGYKKTNYHILQYKQENIAFQQAEQQLIANKTASLTRFIQHAHSVIDNLDILLQFYDQRFTELRFLNYIGRQRADAEMSNILVSGGKSTSINNSSRLDAIKIKRAKERFEKEEEGRRKRIREKEEKKQEDTGLCHLKKK